MINMVFIPKYINITYLKNVHALLSDVFCVQKILVLYHLIY